MQEHGLCTSAIDPFFRQLEFMLDKTLSYRRPSIAMLEHQYGYLAFASTPSIMQKYDPFGDVFPHKTSEYLNPTLLVYPALMMSSGRSGMKYATHSIYDNVYGNWIQVMIKYLQ